MRARPASPASSTHRASRVASSRAAASRARAVHRARRHPSPAPRPRALTDAADVAAVESWQLWFGFFAGVAPFAIAAYEFGKRVRIQRRCARCAGSGLVDVATARERRLVKCTACGGFLPWQSWARFFSAAPGNGGVVRAPQGQTSVFYSVDAATAASRDAVARAAVGAGAAGDGADAAGDGDDEDVDGADGADGDAPRRVDVA